MFFTRDLMGKQQLVPFEMPKTGRKILYDNDNMGRHPINFCLPPLYIPGH